MQYNYNANTVYTCIIIIMYNNSVDITRIKIGIRVLGKHRQW